MFSNSINSSLIRFARPNRVREEGASWSTTTMAGDVGELELDRTEHVRSLSRFSLRGIDYPAGLCSSHLRPRDTSRVHDPSPFARDQRERENPSASQVNLDPDASGLLLDPARDSARLRDETARRAIIRTAMRSLRFARSFERPLGRETDGTDSTGSRQAWRIPRRIGRPCGVQQFLQRHRALDSGSLEDGEYQLCPS